MPSNMPLVAPGSLQNARRKPDDLRSRIPINRSRGWSRDYTRPRRPVHTTRHKSLHDPRLARDPSGGFSVVGPAPTGYRNEPDEPAWKTAAAIVQARPRNMGSGSKPFQRRTRICVRVDPAISTAPGFDQLFRLGAWIDSGERVSPGCEHGKIHRNPGDM